MVLTWALDGATADPDFPTLLRGGLRESRLGFSEYETTNKMTGKNKVQCLFRN